MSLGVTTYMDLPIRRPLQRFWRNPEILLSTWWYQLRPVVSLFGETEGTSTEANVLAEVIDVEPGEPYGVVHLAALFQHDLEHWKVPIPVLLMEGSSYHHVGSRTEIDWATPGALVEVSGYLNHIPISTIYRIERLTSQSIVVGEVVPSLSASIERYTWLNTPHFRLATPEQTRDYLSIRQPAVEPEEWIPPSGVMTSEPVEVLMEAKTPEVDPDRYLLEDDTY